MLSEDQNKSTSDDQNQDTTTIQALAISVDK